MVPLINCLLRPKKFGFDYNYYHEEHIAEILFNHVYDFCREKAVEIVSPIDSDYERHVWESVLDFCWEKSELDYAFIVELTLKDDEICQYGQIFTQLC